MESKLEHRIRQRAYEIWHAHGQADGKADEHWLAAEREVLSSVISHVPARDTASVSTPQKRSRPKAARTSNGARATA